MAFSGVIRKAKETGYKFAKALPATIAINVPKIETKVGINPIVPLPRITFTISLAIEISAAFRTTHKTRAIIIPKIEAITEIEIASTKKSFLMKLREAPSAFIVPISLVLSITETISVFMITIKTTTASKKTIPVKTPESIPVIVT